MSGLKTQSIKFAKGDSLDSIAKEHGTKADQIWKFAGNKGIVQKRGKPDKLQIGDPLVIPPAESKMQEAKKALEANLAVVQGELARIKLRVAALKKLEKDILTSFGEVAKELNAKIAKIETVSTAVDLAAAVTKIGTDVGAIVRKGAGSVKLTAQQMEKHNEELQKEAKKLAEGPLKEASIKAVGHSAESSNEAVQFVQTVAKSWDSMTSPSFWANTAYQLSSGKSWSEAVNTQVTDELKDTLDKFTDTTKHQLVRVRKMQADVAGKESHLNAGVTQLKSLIAGLK